MLNVSFLNIFKNTEECDHIFGRWLPFCGKGINVEFKMSCRKCGEVEIRKAEEEVV